jgi:hypothetical protein
MDSPFGAHLLDRFLNVILYRSEEEPAVGIEALKGGVLATVSVLILTYERAKSLATTLSGIW